MTLPTTLLQDHQLIKLVHSIISVAFLVIAVWLFYRSLIGFFKNKSYTRLDKALSHAFIFNLYLQLVFGLILMANPAAISGQELVSQDMTIKLVTKRFWPIEHIVLMLFALFIANLGLIFSTSTQNEKEKHRKVLVYYTIAILMIGLSLSSTYLV